MTSMKQLKTPLRYPGGKSRALPKLFNEFPSLQYYTHYREPFLGGGSVAIEVTKRYPNMNVWVNDLYIPLYTFWVQLQQRGDELANYLEEKQIKNDSLDKLKELFVESKELMHTGENDLIKGASYWIANKCSFSGISENFSSDANTRFTLRQIGNLREYSKIIKNWKITNLSYEDLLQPEHGKEKTFIYLDPPYEISSTLYGKKGDMHKGFDHNLFAEKCKECDIDLAISYNDVDSVKDRFPDYRKIAFPFTYSMGVNHSNFIKNQHKRNELLLTNY